MNAAKEICDKRHKDKPKGKAIEIHVTMLLSLYSLVD
jgi:hypothetical protein